MRTLVLAAVLLAGCAAEAPRVTGTEHAVAVNWANSDASLTLPTAEAHCAKYGKHAQFAGKPNAFTDAFNCVP
jgi:hypothetical protein